MIGRVRHSAARGSPEERFPLAPYQGRGRYLVHERGCVCLPLRPRASSSTGSTPSKATLLQLPESVNKQTNKPANMQTVPGLLVPSCAGTIKCDGKYLCSPPNRASVARDGHHRCPPPPPYHSLLSAAATTHGMAPATPRPCHRPLPHRSYDCLIVQERRRLHS